MSFICSVTRINNMHQREDTTTRSTPTTFLSVVPFGGGNTNGSFHLPTASAGTRFPNISFAACICHFNNFRSFSMIHHGLYASFIHMQINIFIRSFHHDLHAYWFTLNAVHPNHQFKSSKLYQIILMKIFFKSLSLLLRFSS